MHLKKHEGRNYITNNKTPGKLPGDHAGHLIGDMFGGSPKMDNLVSMNGKKVNQSEYRILENEWAKAISQNKKVEVDIKVEYDSNDRPLFFDIKYRIDGTLNKAKINNIKE